LFSLAFRGRGGACLVLGDEDCLSVVLFVCLILVVRGIPFFLRKLEYIHDRAVSLTFGRQGVTLPVESSQ
jgi:hypothetical protein